MGAEHDEDGGAIDPAEALSNVRDDGEGREEAVRWAGEQMILERGAEELIAELVAEGWDREGAEEIVEEARKETRRERGVVTREDVVRDVNARYRQATGGLSVAFRSGLFGLYGFTTGVMGAIRAVRWLRGVKGKRGE
jgi:hypothetical protein